MIRGLRDNSAAAGSSEAKTDATPTIEFDFKTKFAETKATAKVCLYPCSIYGLSHF